MRRVAVTLVSLLGLALFPVPASAGVCTDTVVIDDAAYTPAVKLAPVQNGLFMCWTNEGTVIHTATSDTGMFDTKGIAPAGSAGVDILGSGSYPYHCNIHPGIQGSLKIRPVADATVDHARRQLRAHRWEPVLEGDPLGRAEEVPRR